MLIIDVRGEGSEPTTRFRNFSLAAFASNLSLRSNVFEVAGEGSGEGRVVKVSGGALHGCCLRLKFVKLHQILRPVPQQLIFEFISGYHTNK